MNRRQRKKQAKRAELAAVKLAQGFAVVGQHMARCIWDTLQSPGFLASPEDRLAHFNSTHSWKRTAPLP